jgi:hypothetical protein
MLTRKFLNHVFVILMLVSLLLSGSVPTLRPTTALAMPGGPTDETKVPHYFGPYPNWANSPYTLSDVAVTITDPGGLGVGATAVASIGANGAVTGITITNPGSGYTAATVDITGAGNGATATATVALSGAVIGITVTASGTGYTAPTVTFTGGFGPGRLLQVGNRLSDRAFVAGSATEGMQSGVFVIVPKALPTGNLTEFLSPPGRRTSTRLSMAVRG